MKSIQNVDYGQFFPWTLWQLFYNQDKEQSCVEAAQWEQTEDQVEELPLERRWLAVCRAVRSLVKVSDASSEKRHS